MKLTDDIPLTTALEAYRVALLVINRRDDIRRKREETQDLLLDHWIMIRDELEVKIAETIRPLE